MEHHHAINEKTHKLSMGHYNNSHANVYKMVTQTGGWNSTTTRWCPPSDVNWFTNPIHYRYIINKNHSHIGVMFTNLAIPNWGTTL